MLGKLGLSRPGARRLRERGPFSWKRHRSFPCTVILPRAENSCHPLRQRQSVTLIVALADGLKFHSRKTLITAPRDPNVNADLHLTRGTSHHSSSNVWYSIRVYFTLSPHRKFAQTIPSYRNIDYPSTGHPIGIVPRPCQILPHTLGAVSGKNHGAPYIVDQSIFLTSVSS